MNDDRVSYLRYGIANEHAQAWAADRIERLEMAVEEASDGRFHLRCPSCDHDDHFGTYCQGWSDCGDACGPHECACSYPDPDNFIEVPGRVPLSLVPGTWGMLDV